jgi:hypothetical protein
MGFRSRSSKAVTEVFVAAAALVARGWYT